MAISYKNDGLSTEKLIEDPKPGTDVSPEQISVPDPQELRKAHLLLRGPTRKAVIMIQGSLSSYIREFLDSKGFTEAIPPVIGPVTDPGLRGADQATFDFYGTSYKIMSSAILYKQMLAASLGSIYLFAPNIRLEPVESIRTRRHLCEFYQVDVEQANSTYHEAMALLEELVANVIGRILTERGELLGSLRSKLTKPSIPFKRIKHREAIDLLNAKGFPAGYDSEIPWRGDIDLEKELSLLFSEPFFVYDYPYGSRSFYDRQDPTDASTLNCFDLIYPNGFGEAASGAEREYEYDKVLARITESGENADQYGWYLEMLRDGIPPSSGFGIGLERFTRYVCGLDSIWEATPYPKLAGITGTP